MLFLEMFHFATGKDEICAKLKGPLRKEKGPLSKWYVPKSIWPSNAWGFDYADGCAFWQTLEALRVVQAAALCLRVLFIDDVYLAGHLRAALGVRLFHTRNFSTYGTTPEKEAETYIACSLKPPALRAVWAHTYARINHVTTISSTSVCLQPPNVKCFIFY